MKIKKLIYTSIVTIFFANFSSAQNSFNFRKDHDALQVRDLNVSSKFYSEILGLEEIPNGGLGDHIRWFQLNDNTQVHLIESSDNIQKNKGVHMAIKTIKLEEFMDYLKSKGVDFENWSGEKGITNDRPDGVKQIYFQDPDGYWIEVNNAG